MNVIETRVVGITKKCPFEVFKTLHRWAYYAELMERTPDGKVIWDESVTSIYSEQAAEAEYAAIQNDWLEVSMEIPVAPTGYQPDMFTAAEKLTSPRGAL